MHFRLAGAADGEETESRSDKLYNGTKNIILLIIRYPRCHPKLVSFIQKDNIKCVINNMPDNNCLPCYMYSCPLCIVRDKTRAYEFGF